MLRNVFGHINRKKTTPVIKKYFDLQKPTYFALKGGYEPILANKFTKTMQTCKKIKDTKTVSRKTIRGAYFLNVVVFYFEQEFVLLGT